MRIVSGSSSEQIYFVAFSTADHVTRVSDHTTAGFSVFFSKAGTTGTTAAVAFTAINSTQMPGVYSLSLLDSTLTALPAGVDSRELCIHISGSMDAVTRTVELYRRVVTTGATLTVNSSGEPTNVMAGLSSIATTLGTIGTKVSSIDTDIDTALARLTSIENQLTSVETDVDSVLTKLTSVETDVDAVLTGVTSIDTKVTAIQAQTTQLAFTQSGKVDANIHYINDVQVQGTGTTVDTWRPV